MKIIAATIVAFLASLMTVVPAHAEDSLYAFAEQGNPGFIQINYAQDATWTIEGTPVEVEAPSTKFFYPEGIQAEVVGTLPSGTTQTFWLQVDPDSNYTRSDVCVFETAPLQSENDRLVGQVTALEDKNERLTNKVAYLRAKIAKIRARR